MSAIYYFALCVSTITIGLSTSTDSYSISDFYPENEPNYDNYHQSYLRTVKIVPYPLSSSSSSSLDQQSPWYNKKIIKSRYGLNPGAFPYYLSPEAQSYRLSSLGLSSSGPDSGSGSGSSSTSDKSLIDDKRSSVSRGTGIDMVFGKKSEKPFRTWGGKR